MYLTRLTFDLSSAQARRDLGDAYEMHRTLVRAFAVNEHSAPPRFLWRLETGPNAWAEPALLVQSAAQADWSALEALPNYLRKPAECKQLAMKQLAENGGSYRFRLLANPTVTRCGKRYGLVGESEQLAWLQRQGERFAFSLGAALVTASDVLVSRKGKARISLRRACFDGVLQVQDRESFGRALTEGIGPAKAFGCGLLSVAPCG